MDITNQDKVNWMALPEEYRKGKFVILPIAYEKNLTYGKGASKGPEEIIKASQYLEYYDEEFNCEPFLEGIELLPSLDLNDQEPEEMIEIVSEKVKQIDDKFLIGLGGDHSVTLGIVNGLESIHDEFAIIQFDAHSDFRDSWNGSTLNHACVAKQLSKKHPITLVGIRSMDKSEKDQIDQNKEVHLLLNYNYHLDKLKEILPKLPDKVFITIDVDVFDPSFIRNTGTPEPGGFIWKDIIDALRLIFENKTVIGSDIVEFSPKINFESESFSLAKLVYKILSLQQVYEKQE
ncbi:MAG: agmatinase [archaeon]|nr:agmatinase [archaeon]